MAHHETTGATDEWYTPPYVFEAMATVFDLDVASPGRKVVPWVPAPSHNTGGKYDVPWSGTVWCNPPFGGRNGIEPWLCRFFAHGDGVALMPDRTSAPRWQSYASQADLILFVAKKIRFIKPDGTKGVSPSTGTCLMAKGARGVAALRMARAQGLGLIGRCE